MRNDVPWTSRKLDENDLLYAVLAMDILLRSGASLEAAINYVANNDYGDVSREFGRVLYDAHHGRELTHALQDSAQRVKNDIYRDLVNAMVRALTLKSGVAATIRQIALRESHKRRTKYRHYLERIQGIGTMFVIFSALIPLIIGIVGFTAKIISSADLPTAGGFSIPDSMINLLIALDVVFLIIFLIYVQIIDPGV